MLINKHYSVYQKFHKSLLNINVKKRSDSMSIAGISSIIHLDFEQKLPEDYSKLTNELFMHIED